MIGRPPLPPEKGKRYALNFRVTKEVHAQIRAIAHASGRSVSQEIEFRISTSIGSAERLAAIEARLTSIEALLRWKNVS